MALWLLALKKVKEYRNTAHELFEKYHSDRNEALKISKAESTS
jgi:hypothetical protein